jgi:tetratricopeptide (TPR) repeat protein
VFKEQGIVDKAIYHFEKAFEFDPAYGLACRNLDDIYLNSGRPEKAKHWLKIAIKIDPENLYGHYWLGKAYYQFLEFEKARDQYFHVLSKEPNLPSVHHDLGLAFFGMRQYSLAIHHVKQAIRGVHTNPFYYLTLSKIHAGLQDVSTALAILDSALSFNRKIPEIWFAKGDLHKSMELYEEALHNYKIAASYHTDHWKGYYKQGVVLYYLGRLDEAKTMLEKARSIDSENGGINHFLGLVYLSMENARFAKPYLLEAAVQDSGNAHIWFHLGQAHSHLNEVALAEKCFE